MEEVRTELKTNKEEHKSMVEKIDKLGEKIEGIKVSIAELPETLTKNFDERYASKRIERNVDRAVWLVISTIIVALLAILIK